MILQVDNTIDTFSIGNNNVIKGTIDSNKVGKMFQLLSNLYSDKESIVLQEITANAQDSYKRIRKEGIVNIKFNKEDRSLHIIDKAEGISPYVFENYITKLGSSSKENEDDSAGMLGIGFFSGWCITNCIYLTTIYNNTKYIYSCSKRDYEEPEFTLLLEEPTDEENGTDYWFYLPPSTYSYRDTEYEKFQKALSKLRYFHNVTVEGFNFKNDYRIYQGRTFIFNEDYYYNSYDKDYKELEICFGNTPYPINWEKVGVNKITIPVALKFELNEPLMILPSREALGWNNTTIECVKNKIIDFVEEITEIYKSQTQPYDNILDYLEVINDKQKIKIGDSKINISCLGLKNTLVYSKISHLDIQVPVKEEVIFENYTKFWNSKYTKRREYISKPSLWSKSKFYYSNEGLKKNKTSQIYFDCILTYEQHPAVFRFEYKQFVPSYSPLLGSTKLPDNIDEQIREFYQYVKEDIESRFLDYDSIIPAKRVVNKVKRASSVYLATKNGNDYKTDYNIKDFVEPLYLFLTTDKEEYNEILKYTKSFITHTKDKKRRIIEVILTAKKYHPLFKGCNIITLEEWFKTDMFVNKFRREVQKYQAAQYLGNHYFKIYIQTYNKRLWELYGKDKTNSYINVIVQKGLDLKIPYVDNYSCLEEYQDDYQEYYNNSSYYKKNRIIKFLRNKLAKCKK